MENKTAKRLAQNMERRETYRTNYEFFGHEIRTYFTDDLSTDDCLKWYHNVWYRVQLLSMDRDKSGNPIPLSGLTKYAFPHSSLIPYSEWRESTLRECERMISFIQNHIDEQMFTNGAMTATMVRNTLQNFPDGVSWGTSVEGDKVSEKVIPYYATSYKVNEFLQALIRAKQNLKIFSNNLKVNENPPEEKKDIVLPDWEADPTEIAWCINDIVRKNGKLQTKSFGSIPYIISILKVYFPYLKVSSMKTIVSDRSYDTTNKDKKKRHDILLPIIRRILDEAIPNQKE